MVIYLGPQLLIIFSSERHSEFSRIPGRVHNDWSTAHLAVFNVFCITHGFIDQEVYRLAAIGAVLI